MKKVFILAVMFLLFASVAHAAVVELSWDYPTTNTDGSALTDLASFDVIYSSDDWATVTTENIPTTINAPTPSTPRITAQITCTDDIEIKWKVLAVDSSGNRSDDSNIITYTATTIPSACTGLTVIQPTP